METAFVLQAGRGTIAQSVVLVAVMECCQVLGRPWHNKQVYCRKAEHLLALAIQAGLALTATWN
jgi:hypothetical protein